MFETENLEGFSTMMNRRDSLKLMGMASLASVIPGCSAEQLETAAEKVSASGTPELENRIPTVLNRHEYETLTLLVDHIIPSDTKSGSASDAGVPAFIDFLLEDVPSMQNEFRGGLGWLDHWAIKEYEAEFIECSGMQQHVLMTQIAYPMEAPERLAYGVKFFSTLRNLTASGFFSSRIGMADLKFMGNVARPEWNGCPDEALRHLGVSYES